MFPLDAGISLAAGASLINARGCKPGRLVERPRKPPTKKPAIPSNAAESNVFPGESIAVSQTVSNFIRFNGHSSVYNYLTDTTPAFWFSQFVSTCFLVQIAEQSINSRIISCGRACSRPPRAGPDATGAETCEIARPHSEHTGWIRRKGLRAFGRLHRRTIMNCV